MGTYVKKPLEIEAFRWTGSEDQNEEPMWIVDAMKSGKVGIGFNKLMIHTREGTMEASPGDYIIRGIKGELYPCKPDIFEASYEAVGEIPAWLQPHQRRVVIEERMLAGNLERLLKFAGTVTFRDLPGDEGAALVRQLTAMQAYHMALNDRLRLFKPEGPQTPAA